MIFQKRSDFDQGTPSTAQRSEYDHSRFRSRPQDSLEIIDHFLSHFDALNSVAAMSGLIIVHNGHFCKVHNCRCTREFFNATTSYRVLKAVSFMGALAGVPPIYFLCFASMWKRCGQCRTASSWTGPVFAAARISRNFVLFSLVAFALCGRAHAAEPAQPKYGWRECGWAATPSRCLAALYRRDPRPLERALYDPGFRLRAHSGFGEFNYVSPPAPSRSFRAP